MIPPLTIEQAFQLAIQHHQAGRLQQAESLYRQILAQHPLHAGSLHFLGVVAHQSGRNVAAVDLIQRSLAINSGSAQSHSNLGIALRELGRVDEAIAALRRSIVLEPNLAEAHSNLGNVLHDKGMLEESIAAYRQAIALRPSYAEAHSNLSNPLRDSGQMDAAIAAARQAIALEPGYADAWNNLGIALAETGHGDQAIAAYRQAIALRADFPMAHYDLALALLLRGDLSAGWEEYEWRWRCRELRSVRWNQAKPHWDGSELNGRTILLHAEQGLGDTIQFIRYASLVAMRGGPVLLQCAAPLHRLLAGVSDISRLLTPAEPLPPFDVHCPLLGLPHVLRTTLDSIPTAVPFLSSDPALTAMWRTKLAVFSAGVRVGLVWAGNPQNKADRRRSVHLKELIPLLSVPRAHFFSLQQGIAADQTSDVTENVRPTDCTSEIHDFADTAALIGSLDLVITVDTAVAHLAGAMGKPVWVMLPFVPDWRWMLNRSDSPWYPTMRLFRQPALGDWKSVITEVAKAVSEWKC